MQSTGTAQEMAALREQIATAGAAVKRHKRRVLARREAGKSSSQDYSELEELIEAYDFMVARLSRLESQGFGTASMGSESGPHADR